MTASGGDAGHDPQADLRAFRDVLGRYPTGVTIVTARVPDNGGADVGMTMNSFSSVSLDPPLVLFCVDKRSRSLPAWLAASAYGVSVLSEGQDAISNGFATARGDKWSNIPLTRGQDGVALIEGALAHFECVPHERHEGGDHMIFLARVERYRLGSRPGPLVFCHGRYNYLKPGTTAPPEWPLPIHY